MGNYLSFGIERKVDMREFIMGWALIIIATIVASENSPDITSLVIVGTLTVVGILYIWFSKNTEKAQDINYGALLVESTVNRIEVRIANESVYEVVLRGIPGKTGDVIIWRKK
jgi:hypothetical protein